MLSISGYEDLEAHSVNHDIWIQSIQAHEQNVWYRLGKPSSEYKRFHEPFLWVANFAKYFVDFLNNHMCVSINAFSRDFYTWLHSFHGTDLGFQKWIEDYGDTDFRRAVAAHPKFHFNEARQINYYIKHPICSVQVD